MNIEMRHLRYFVAVAEDASFTAAARRVHVAAHRGRARHQPVPGVADGA
jgi:hypothetical protein